MARNVGVRFMEGRMDYEKHERQNIPEKGSNQQR
jgi:hypothetical protein